MTLNKDDFKAMHDKLRFDDPPYFFGAYSLQRASITKRRKPMRNMRQYITNVLSVLFRRRRKWVEPADYIGWLNSRLDLFAGNEDLMRGAIETDRTP